MNSLKKKNFLPSFFIIILIAGGALSCKSDPFPETVLPVHPDAISINRVDNRPVKGAKAVTYHVPIEFPASTIVEFYNRELSSMGYIPFNAANESRPLGKWSSFNSRTGNFEETEKPPGAYVAHWLNNSNKTWIWLMIYYKYDGSDPSWRNTAAVSCNMAKYSAYEKTIKAIELMKSKPHNK